MYSLSDHCFTCRVGDRWIVLDVLRDRYVGVDAHALAEIGSSIRGWPADASTGGISSTRARATLEALLEAGVLTVATTGDKAFAACDAKAVARTLHAAMPLGRPGAGRFAAALLACGKADWILRRWPMRRMVSTVRRVRKAHAGNVVDDTELSRALGDFQYTRPFYPRAYLCLFDSLAACLYLHRLGAAVDFVFGVSANPFEAHCWLQREAMVLNDQLERV